MNHNFTPFSAVVLAGDRTANDPLPKAAGVNCKALVPVGDRPMVLRVLDALREAQSVKARILCGPNWAELEKEPELRSHVVSEEVQWMEPQTTPSTSADFVLQSISEQVPILLTTADHALLTPEIVDYFCSHARASNSDVVVGVADHQLVSKAFPTTKRTVIRFRDKGYCGCNLFAFLTPKGRTIAQFWKKVEDERKKPLRLISLLGWMAVLRYLLGQMTLAQGLAGLSTRLTMRIEAVHMPFPQAAVDVDSIGDWELVKEILKNQKSG